MVSFFVAYLRYIVSRNRHDKQTAINLILWQKPLPPPNPPLFLSGELNQPPFGKGEGD